MGTGWHDALIAVILLAAFVVPRVFARPEQRPWHVWLPAVVAIGAIVYGASTGSWGFAALFAVVLLIEVGRTWSVWKHVRD